MKIEIYQINTNRDKRHVKFIDLVTTEIDPSIYDLVFAGEVDAADLEDVFWIFNERLPEGYAGHSMSVSDVVHVLSGGKVQNRLLFLCVFRMEKDRFLGKCMYILEEKNHASRLFVRQRRQQPGKPLAFCRC